MEYGAHKITEQINAAVAVVNRLLATVFAGVQIVYDLTTITKPLEICKHLFQFM